MALLTKKVEIGLYSTNIKHYENSGYIIPRVKNNRGKLVVSKNTKIFVKVEDLQMNSHIEIEIECDCCKKVYKVKYGTYNRQNHNGKIYCSSCSPKIFNSGENSYLWSFNLTQEEREKGRKYPEYVEFIKKVLKRDNYTCQCCGQHNNDMEIHHLDGYNWCKDKRTDETNAITLCNTCHKNFHMKYGKGDNIKEQFEEWIGYAIEMLQYEDELSTARKIINITTKEIYNNVKDCMDKLKLKSESSIYSVCNKKLISANGQKLMWLNEYENSEMYEIQQYINKPIGSSSKKAKIICITTGKIFNSKREAGNHYDIKSYDAIGSCCTKKLKSCGKLKDGTKLEWMYYYEWIKSTNQLFMTNKEKN